jgi:hypothetical protein
MKERKKYAKSFEKWLREDVEMTFGIKWNDTLNSLKIWLATDYPIQEKELENLADLHVNLKKNLDFYNEDELKLFFISEVLRLVRFQSDVYRAFSQRPMEFSTKTVDNQVVNVKGVVDLLVAKGQQTPKTPYFFLQEFKPSLKHNNDPLGQLLIAMLAAQVNNQIPNKPIFGSYILGEHWYFVVLDGKEYAVSKAYDVRVLEELINILRLLKVQKMYIDKELGLI